MIPVVADAFVAFAAVAAAAVTGVVSVELNVETSVAAIAPKEVGTEGGVAIRLAEVIVLPDYDSRRSSGIS